MTGTSRNCVLIVDDSPTNISMLSDLLRDLYRTKIATNGEKALAVANADDRPDIILLDVLMPGMDGYEVCRRLKANPATAEIPVIFLTSRSTPEDEALGFELGAVDYIHKPFSPSLVRARVATQLTLLGALRQAREASKKADDLLDVLLPKRAANEIRSFGTVIPCRHDNVAVLFCDVANFTAYCNSHEPEEVIAQLDALFVRFEGITAKYNLEKIKTIGDAFMAAAGLLNDVEDPIGSAIRCGLEMAETMLDAQLGWTVRVGIHSGTVISGIVGQARYQFDIWGDTVNVAARMAGQGRPGAVIVSEEMWQTLGDRFTGTLLGDVDVKGKGVLTIFEVTGARVVS